MSGKLIPLSKEDLRELVKGAYGEGRQDQQSQEVTKIRWTYNNSITKAKLDKLLKGE